MKKIYLLSLLLLFFANSHAGVSKGIFEKRNISASRIDQIKKGLSPEQKKISSLLRDKVDQIKSLKKYKTIEEIRAQINSKTIDLDSGEKLKVNIVFQKTISKADLGSAVVYLEDIGCAKIKKYWPDEGIDWMPEVICYAPYDRLDIIASLKIVASIQPVVGPVLNSGSKLTEGDSQLNVNLARSTNTVSGAGIRVGVVSDGIDSRSQPISTGDLPTDIINVINEGGDEGTAMMEIIYDLAPGCSFSFASAGSSSNEMSGRISELIAPSGGNCRIIVDDIGWPGDPYFTDGKLAQDIANWVQYYDLIYVSAAGNSAENMYTADYSEYDDGSLKWHIFYEDNLSNIQNMFSLENNQKVEIILQWADDWETPLADFDIYLYELSQSNSLGNGGKDVQGSSTTNPPREVLTYTNTSGSARNYVIQIKMNHLSPNTAYPKLKLISLNRTEYMPPITLQYTHQKNQQLTNQIFGHAAAEGVISVAAYDALNTDNVESYSSRGPTYLDNTNDPVIVRETPVITATDNVKITGAGGFGYQDDSGDWRFTGTSAAAPHIAGIAALYKEKFPSSGHQDFYNDLTSTASGIMGGLGGTWNSNSGYGKADAFEALGGGPLKVTVDQQNHSFSSIGNIEHWESQWISYAAPKDFFWDDGSIQTLKASTSIIANEKYHNWNEKQSNTIFEHFNIDKNTNTLTAQFYNTYPVTVKNNLSGGSGGIIFFKDPWLRDYTESPYGSRNRGMEAPFKQRTSPFSPDYATSYNGDVYQGVFLGQGYDDNTQTWNPPYYSVRADQTQNTTEHGESVTWHFQNWSGTDVQYQYPDQAETPVVFNAAGATAEARYKGHLTSNKTTATGPNNSRVLTRSLKKYDGYLYGSGQKYIHFMAYADGGEIWYSKAETDDQTTNDNINWLTEKKISDGQGGNHNPSVTTLGNVAYFTWAQKIGNTWYIRFRYYNNNNDSYYWSPVSTIASFTSSTTPTPVIALTENPTRVMVVSNVNGKVKSWLRKNGSWQYAGLNINGSQPAICANVDVTDENPNNPFFGDIALVYTYNDDIYLRNWSTSGESWSSPKKVSVQNLFSLGNKNATVAYSGGTAKIAWVALNDEIGSHAIYERGWSAPGNSFSSQTTVIEDPDDSSNPSVSWDAGNAWLESVVYENGGTLYKAKKTSGWTRTAIGPGRYPSTTPHNNETLVYNKYNSLPYLIRHYHEAPASGDGGGDGPFVPKTSGQTANTEKMSASRRLVYGFGDAMLSVDISNIRFEGQALTLSENNHSDTLKAVTSGELTLDITALQKNDLSEELAKEILFNIYFVANGKETLLQSLRLSDLKPSTPDQREGGTHHLLLASRQSRDGYFRIGFSNHIPVEYTVLRASGELQPLNKSMEAFDSGLARPSSFALQQNYPNPFNPLTHIVFDLPQGASVRLAVYDLTGRKVADLVNGYKEAGRYNVAFDASHLASGMYIYRIEAGKYSAVRRMLLMK